MCCCFSEGPAEQGPIPSAPPDEIPAEPVAGAARNQDTQHRGQSQLYPELPRVSDMPSVDTVSGTPSVNTVSDAPLVDAAEVRRRRLARLDRNS